MDSSDLNDLIPAAAGQFIAYSCGMIARLIRPAFSWPNACTLLVLAVMAYVFWRPPADLDFCWQIRTGERILETGRINQPDAFSYTIGGQNLPDHEWLYEVLLALVWRSTGDAGLKLMRVFLFAAPLVILGWQLRQRGVREHGIVLTLFACAVVFMFFERLRPLVCSTIGLQLVAGWLHDHCHGRRRLDWRLPVTMLLWGNLHPAVIMGQATIAGAIAWEWFSYWRHRPKSDLSVARGVTIWGALGLLASLVAPDPIGRFLYPFAAELRHPAQRLFIEIRPPWMFLLQKPYTIIFALLMGFAWLGVLAMRRKSLRGWEWGLVAGVSGLAFTAVRGIGDWLMITTVLAVPQIGSLLVAARPMKNCRRLFRWALRLDLLFKKVFRGAFLQPQYKWAATLPGVVACVALIIPSTLIPNCEAPTWPTEAANWMTANELPAKGPVTVFARVNEGSYLLWRFPTRVKVHSDTRGFYYPGETIMDSYYLPEADDQWPRRLDRVLAQGTRFFLLPVESNFFKLLEPYLGVPLHRDAKFAFLSAAQVEIAATKASTLFRNSEALARQSR